LSYSEYANGQVFVQERLRRESVEQQKQIEKKKLLCEKKRQEVCKPMRVSMLWLIQENLEILRNVTAVSLSGKIKELN